MEENKDLIEALGYVDHILNEEGYETWCEARCTIARAKKACYELIEKSMELTGLKQACKNYEAALKMVLEIDQERQNLPHSIFTTLELEQIKALINSDEISQSEASANG